MVYDAQYAVKTEGLKATLHPRHIFIFKRNRIDICISYSCIACTKYQRDATYRWTQLCLKIQETVSIMAAGAAPSMAVEAHAPSSHLANRNQRSSSHHKCGQHTTLKNCPIDPLPSGPHLLKAQNLPKRYHQLTTRLVGDIPQSSCNSTLSPRSPGSTSEMHLRGLGR